MAKQNESSTNPNVIIQNPKDATLLPDFLSSVILVWVMATPELYLRTLVFGLVCRARLHLEVLRLLHRLLLDWLVPEFAYTMIASLL